MKTFILKYGFFALMTLVEYTFGIFSNTLTFLSLAMSGLFIALPATIAPTNVITTVFAYALPFIMAVCTLFFAFNIGVKIGSSLQYAISVFIFGGLAGMFMPTLFAVTADFFTDVPIENSAFSQMMKILGSIALLVWLCGFAALCGGLYKQRDPNWHMMTPNDFDIMEFIHMFIPWTYFFVDDKRASEAFKRWISFWEKPTEESHNAHIVSA